MDLSELDYELPPELIAQHPAERRDASRLLVYERATGATRHRTFAELLFDPAAQLNFRLTPGDCLILDNTRLLHARTAFEAVGGRHLQGTYADLDGLLSTLAVLEHAR